jgi:hypothetical protein
MKNILYSGRQYLVHNSIGSQFQKLLSKIRTYGFSTQFIILQFPFDKSKG